jgi:nucleoside-diphosphate-sugar epimerase
MSGLRILVTGHHGYLGPAVIEELQARGHEVIGLDVCYYEDDRVEPGPSIRDVLMDVRDVAADDLAGVDAIVHLAGLSNDPLGTLAPLLTDEINVQATLHLAGLARAAGVRRFVNFSSCSVYGAATEEWVDERTAPRPVTAYGVSKVDGEVALLDLSDARFSVISLRNATAFGYSPNLRIDLVVNDLTLGAMRTQLVRLNSDGTAWRPICHVRDIAQAAALAVEAPADRVAGEVVNVGSTAQNYRILEIAAAIERRLAGTSVAFADGAGPDQRSYRVRFDHLAEVLPDFRARFDLASGVDDLIANVERVGLDRADVSPRLRRLERMLADGRVDASLRPVPASNPAGAPSS